MTVSQQPDSPATPELVVRDYAEGDYRACRALWAELTEYHRSIYGDPSIGGDDPGAGFDGYLATSQRIGSWVAESDGRVVGLTGLLDRGRSAEVEPVAVTEAARDQGIGRRLISRVVEEALARGYELPGHPPRCSQRRCRTAVPCCWVPNTGGTHRPHDGPGRTATGVAAGSQPARSRLRVLKGAGERAREPARPRARNCGAEVGFMVTPGSTVICPETGSARSSA